MTLPTVKRIVLPTEKISPMALEEFLSANDKDKKDFDLVPLVQMNVGCAEGMEDGREITEDVLAYFRRIIPNRVQAIVEYKVNFSYGVGERFIVCQSGIGLAPKKDLTRKKKE